MRQSGLRESRPGTKARTQAKGRSREDTETAGKPDHEGVGGSGAGGRSGGDTEKTGFSRSIAQRGARGPQCFTGASGPGPTSITRRLARHFQLSGCFMSLGSEL